MPKNCSKDVSRVVNYIDQVYKSGNINRQQELKEMFGLGGLKHFDDFAAYVVFAFFEQVNDALMLMSLRAIENGPWLWQSNSFYTGYSGFFKFCDAVEVRLFSNSRLRPC